MLDCSVPAAASMLPPCVHDYKLSQCTAAQRPAGGGPGGAQGQQEAGERAQDHRQEDARTGQIFLVRQQIFLLYAFM